MSNDEYVYINIEQLSRGEYQPRREFLPESLEELAQSIRTHGLIQPIVVRPTSHNQYEIIVGERRWRAAQLIPLHRVKCIIRRCTDGEAAEVALIENIQRENLNPIEEAKGYLRLMNEFGYTHEEMANKLGKGRTKITNLLRLLKLDNRVQAHIQQGELTEGHGRILASLPIGQQYEIAEQCVKNKWAVHRLSPIIAKLREKVATVTSTKKDEANYREFERSLGEYLGAPVTVERSEKGKGGSLKIDFFDNEILKGLLERMGARDNG